MPDAPVDLLPGLAAVFVHTFGQAFATVIIGVGAAVLCGGPLGILLFFAGDAQPAPRPRWTVNALRAFPFVVLLIALVPLSRPVAGVSTGPLAIVAVPCFARLVAQTLRAVPRGVIDAARAMGASDLQLVTRVLLVEARAGLVLALAALATGFLAYAALAGIVGGGGIGALAVLGALVPAIQATGTRWARRLDKR